MGRKSLQWTNLRWKRWAAAMAGLLAAYTAAGFWLVPALIKSQVPKFVQTELARQAKIGEVSFNPYTLRLEAQDLRLDEADGTALFAIGQLSVDLQWKSLVRRAWSFDEVRITEPSARLLIAPDGKFNLAELLATLARRPRDASTDTGLVRLIVEHIALERGKVEFHDRHAGYDNSFSPIDFSLDHFSTLPEQNGTYTFSAESAQGGKLHWKGEVMANPIGGSGELTLTKVSLPELAVYLKPYTRASVVAGRLDATLPYRFFYSSGKFDARLADATLALRDLALARENAKVTFATLSQLDVSDISVDPVRREATVGEVHAVGGNLTVRRDANGELDLAKVLVSAPAPATTPGKGAGNVAESWRLAVDRVDLSQFGAAIEDQGTGIKVHVQDAAVKLQGASSDLSQSVKFEAGLRLREGGQLSAQGSVVPANGALQAEVGVRQLALAPLQALLDKYLKLKIARGNVSAQGRLVAGPGGTKGFGLHYVGELDISSLKLNEEDGETFAEWKYLGTQKLTASLNPHRLEIPDLRLVEPKAILIIETDRSFNAARLLVRPATPAATDAAPQQAAAQAMSDPFPVRIQRLRVQNGKLNFSDLSLLPQFSAKIYELKGVVNGLSSNRGSPSQIELDGRVDEFGLARIRGELYPFAPRDNTNIGVLFRNVDMEAISPYTMKFAGYKIADGKISLDLQYKVRNSQLEGANQIVIDKLTLGERVDSPDALKLPLELAIAILKDDQGRIDLDLPVSGNLSDPKFSYGAIIWKAVVSLVSKIVTAPFRALGKLFGLSGEKLEAIEFDPGSDKLLPPELEKLAQVGQVLSKRTQLKLVVPGQYSEAADGAALRARAVRTEIARRAGIKLEADEEPAVADLGDRAVRGAVRELYAERFGAAELEKQKKAAEETVSAPAAPATKTETRQEPLPMWQRLGKLIQGEPQVADAGPFYRKLQERLEQNQPLAADALTSLGAQRASAIVTALKEAGVDPARAAVAAPEKIISDAGKPVPLKLGLATK